jgi:hypothetical protein
MVRTLKILGLMASGIFVLGGVSASSAMAEEEVTQPVASFTTQKYKSTLTGTQDGPNHKFAFGVPTTECTSSHFDGVEALVGPVTSIEFTPTYSNCNSVILGDKDNPTTITHNGCTYLYTVHKKLDKNGDEWEGDFHLECPEGVKGIEIHIWDTKEKHELSEATKCTLIIEPQTIKGIKYNNLTEGGNPLDITIEAKEVEVVAKKLSGTLGNCGAAEQVTKYTGNITVDSLDEGKNIIWNKIVEGMP